MGIYRGVGGTGDSNTDATVTEVTQKAAEASASATASADSATEAATSASLSSTSATTSSNQATISTTKAQDSATSATASAASASVAEGWATTGTVVTVAGAIANVNTVAGSIANVNTVATNIADVNKYADQYLGSIASDPTTRTDGSTLLAGDMYFNSSVDELRVYSGTQWRAGTIPPPSAVATITALLALPSAADEELAYVSDPVRGGTFIYDSARSSENDGGLVFNGWVRQFHGFINSNWYTNYAASATALDGVERVDGALWQSLSDEEGQGAIWKYGKNDQRGWNPVPYNPVTAPSGYATNDVSYVFLHDFKPRFANGNRTDGANVYLGGRAGSFSAAPDAAAVGNYNIHCSYNTAVGHQAINNLTTAYNCTATGVNAGRYLTEGYGNTFNGRDAAHATTIGHYNCAMGQSALFSNTVGYENIAIGVTAMRDVGGNQNIGIGVDSLFNAATGNKNIGIGYQAGYGITSGSNNTIIGQTPIANYPNGAQSGLLVISAGAVPRIQGDAAGKLSLSGDVPTATLEYRGVDNTVYNGTAAGGQVAGGSTLLMANDGSINNGISQLVLQPRLNKPVCRIVATDGLTSTLRFVTNDTEKLFITATGAVRPTADNSQPLGGASNRWSTVFAGTGTINTSDDREKTYSEITDTEQAVALELKRNMRKFKYNDAIELKGDGARIHFGASAQTVKSIFESHGLVAEDYAILCHDTWEEDGVTKDIYGLRYEELLSFIISAI